MGKILEKAYTSYYNYRAPPSKLDKFDSNILNLKLVRDKIKVSIASANQKEAQFKSMAKIYLKENNKDRAKFYLSKSKIFKVQSETLSITLFQVLEQIEMIETSKVQLNSMRVLQEGNSVLKQCLVDIEKFKDIREDMDAIKSEQQEVSEFLQGINSNHDQDIENELNSLINPSQIEQQEEDISKSKIFREAEKNEEEEKKDKEWILL